MQFVEKTLFITLFVNNHKCLSSKQFSLINTSTFKTDKYGVTFIRFILLAGLPILVFQISITKNV